MKYVETSKENLYNDVRALLVNFHISMSQVLKS